MVTSFSDTPLAEPKGFVPAQLTLALLTLPYPETGLHTASAAAAGPVPSDLELNKLVWSTMAAVDHANQAGNYSVLRDLAAPGFQSNNDPVRLAQVFASLRTSDIDLSNALLLAPTYRKMPKIVSHGVIEVQGYFGLRPTPITFDLYFQWDGGKWKLFGISIIPTTVMKNRPSP